MNRIDQSTANARPNLRRQRLALLLSSILCSGIAPPSFAQTVNLPPLLPAGSAPVRSPADENSVNLGTGRFEFSVEDVSIGNSNSGGLTHFRHWLHKNWRDGFQINVTKMDNIYTGKFQTVVSVGSKSYTFTDQGGLLADGPYVSEQGDGSTLTESGGNIITFASSDGTSIIFDKNLATIASQYLAGLYGDPDSAKATDIISPKGERIKITYKTTSTVDPIWGTTSYSRIRSVTNNYGYHLKYEYDDAVSPMTIKKGADIDS